MPIRAGNGGRYQDTVQFGHGRSNGYGTHVIGLIFDLDQNEASRSSVRILLSTIKNALLTPPRADGRSCLSCTCSGRRPVIKPFAFNAKRNEVMR